MAPRPFIAKPNKLIDMALRELGISSDYKLAKLLGVSCEQISKARREGKAPANVFFGLYRNLPASLYLLRTLEGTENQEHAFVPINTPTDILWKAIKSGSESEIAALIGPKPKGL